MRGDAVKLLVLGGGMAGLATALATRRAGHDVVLLERDADNPVGDAAQTFESWHRAGVAQFRPPHNFLGLGRLLRRDRTPDVCRALLEAGAVEIEQFRFLDGATPTPGDADLATNGCRRPVFDAALRRAIQAEPAILVRAGCRATRLAVSSGDPAQVQDAVLASGETVDADLVADASDRGGRTTARLADAGLGPAADRSSRCGLLYDSRHFGRRDRVPDPPYASVLAGPRGDLGFVAYAGFVADNRSFALIFMVPPGDHAFRALQHPDAYIRAASLLPGGAAWIDPDAAESAARSWGTWRVAA